MKKPFWERDTLRGDSLGPIAHFGAMFYFIVGFLFTTGFASWSPKGPIFPGISSYALLLGAMGVVLLTPGEILKKIPISFSILFLLTWIFLSSFWTDSPSGSAFFLKRDMPIYIGFVLIVGVLPLETIKKSFLLAIRVMIIGTLVAVLIFPEARLHTDEVFADGTYPGWHGFFNHKNTLSPITVFGLLTILAFERNTLWKYFGVASSIVILIFSTSGTGLSGGIVAVAVFIWLKLYSDLDARSGTFFFISSIGLGIIGIWTAVLSLASLTGAYGKDLSFSGRTDIWNVALQFVARKPINGWGVGGLLWDPEGESKSAATHEFHRLVGFPMPHPHSGVFDVLLQLGFVGLAIFLAIYISVWVKGWQVMKSDRDLGIWIISVLIAQVFMSLSESLFLGAWLVILIIMKGILMREKNNSAQPKQVSFDEILL